MFGTIKEAFSSAIKDLADFFDRLDSGLFPKKATAVIPCYNEERRVGKVVENCLRCPLIGEVLVVDDGSIDGSAYSARKAGATVVSHRKNKGKGAAIKTGTRLAKNDTIVFLDADLENISPISISALARPVLEGKAILSKATFEREGGGLLNLWQNPSFPFFFPKFP